MLLSIIIPCYNSEKWIEECVLSALQQTYADTEVIFVDNESTDRSVDIVSKIKENHEQKRIEFIDDDEMEDFYNHYGYEPDEQSNEILDKSIGVLSNKKDIELYNNCKLIMGC